MTVQDPQSDANAIIESTKEAVLAAASFTERAPGLLTAILPQGYIRQDLDIQEYLDKPRRKTGHVQLTTGDSFAQYLIEHRTAGTTLYANDQDFSVEAVIDDHDSESPHFREHRATLGLQRTPACVRWYGAHGKYLDQEMFAQLVEDGLTEIAAPSGADLLELSQTMHATTSVNFRSGIRLQSGQVQLNYVEEIDAKAGSDGKMVIPEKITLVFSPFYGAEPVQIDARLRYRIQGQRLALGVWLIRGDEVIRDAFAAELDRIEAATHDGDFGLKALWGTSE